MYSNLNRGKSSATVPAVRSWMSEHKTSKASAITDVATPAPRKNQTRTVQQKERSPELQAAIDMVMNPKSLDEVPCPRATDFTRKRPRKHEQLAWDYYGNGKPQTVVTVRSAKHAKDSENPYFVLDNGYKVTLTGKVHGMTRCVVYRDDDFVAKHEKQALLSMFHCFDGDRCSIKVLRRIGAIITDYHEQQAQYEKERREAKEAGEDKTPENPEKPRKSSKIDVDDAKDRKASKIKKKHRKTSNKTGKTTVEDDDSVSYSGPKTLWGTRPSTAVKSKRKASKSQRTRKTVEDF